MTTHGPAPSDPAPPPAWRQGAGLLAGLTLAVGLVLTLLAGRELRKAEETDALRLTEHLAGEVSASLGGHIREYAALAESLAKTLPEGEDHSLADLDQAFADQPLGKALPGFQAVGEVESVSHDFLPELQARLARQWGPALRLQASGGEPRTHVVTLLAPVRRFPELAGQVLDPKGPRSEALAKAIEQNRAVLTAPLAVAGEPALAWVVFPVYRGGGAAATAAWRQEAAHGAVFVAFDPGAALVATINGLGVGRDVVLSDITDGGQVEIARQVGARSGLLARREFAAGGRRWQVQVGRGVSQYRASEATFAAGAAISVLLALLARHLLTRDALARRQALALTANLREQETRLRRTEEFLSRLIETMPAPVMVKDAQLRYLIVNRAAGELLGVPAGEVLGKTVSEVLPPDFARRQSEQDAAVLAAGTASVREDILARPGVNPAPMSVRKSRLEGVDGAPVVVTVVTDLSEERRAQAQLAEMHAASSAVLAAIPDVLVQLDGDLRFVGYHAGDSRDLTYAPERFLGRSIDEVFSPVRADQYRWAAQQARMSGEVQVIEYASWDGARQAQDYEARVAPLSQGGFMVVTRRITERKCAERALRESEARWQFALEGSGDGVWEWDVVGQRVYRSRRWYALLGHDREADWQSTEHWLANVHPDDREGTEAKMAALMRGDTDAYSNEYRLRTAQGEWMWVLARGKVLGREDDGRPRVVLGTTTDMSERKRAEWALRESELRFRRIADTAPVLLWMSSPDGVLTYVNNTWLDFVGASAEDVLGAGPGEWIHPDDRRVSAWCAGARTPMEEVRLRRFDGEYRWIVVRGQPREDGLGNPNGYIGTCTDITDQKRAEQDLRSHRDHLRRMVTEQTRDLIQAKEAAEAASEAKSRFLANMSHELRTPLHAVMSFAKLGESKVERMSVEKIRDYFERIRTAGAHLLALLNDLLDLSKLEAGQMHLELRPLDLEQVTRGAAREFEGLFLSRRLSLEVVCEPGRPRVFGDAGRIGQVLRNLLSNAVKFTAEGSRVTVRIAPARLALGESGGSVEALSLVVADQGIGIPEDELESVFDKFVQSSKTRSGAGGTGLGLSICREIVLAHQGTIHARNRPEGGAEFELLLPAAADPEPQSNPKQGLPAVHSVEA